MRIKLFAPSLIAASLICTSFPAQAQQFSTVAEVLRECPDLDRAIACPAVAGAFISPPNSPNDTQIVTLVGALAAAGQLPRVPLRVCLNTADGLRVLATGVVGAGTAVQIRDIADSLCLGVRTAAIPAEDTSDDDSDGNGGNGGANVVVGGNGGAIGGNGGANGGGDEDDGNNGHGNDDDHDDGSNPGQGGNGGGDEDDGNNGHGNDDDRDDDSNPGLGRSGNGNN